MSTSDNNTGDADGFLGPRRNTKPQQKMQWSDQKDRQLLLFTHSKYISPKEFQKIANSFPEKPTQKAIQERLSKLRAEQNALIEKHGIIVSKSAPIDPAEDSEGDDEGEGLSGRDASPAPTKRRKRTIPTSPSGIAGANLLVAISAGGEVPEPAKKKVRVSQSSLTKQPRTTDSGRDNSRPEVKIEQAGMAEMTAQNRKFAEHDYWHAEQSDREESAGKEGEDDEE